MNGASLIKFISVCFRITIPRYDPAVDLSVFAASIGQTVRTVHSKAPRTTELEGLGMWPKFTSVLRSAGASDTCGKTKNHCLGNLSNQ